ncbi:MAG TPA: ribonuclease H family protein [Candidatus Pacearchaeota archaeon]|nr:ribonuclease H family protein [Candidatus Pacearchaeota archaeon]HPR79697.1 ribonuclease H family protein [Candidatus Pacearchaeota archaeon]
MSKKKYYAYSLNGKHGITDNWPECQKIVSGMENAKYKGFETKDQAERWLDLGADYKTKNTASIKGIYFDAGTGAGKGVETSVTDENGNSLLNIVMKKKDIDEKGNHLIVDNVTNNFGELLACKYALEIALKKNIKNVFGDSKLIIDYWSKGYIKKEMPEETISLSNEVKKLRYAFEKEGGKIEHISGGSNPADLGFHRG